MARSRPQWLGAALGTLLGLMLVALIVRLMATVRPSESPPEARMPPPPSEKPAPPFEAFEEHPPAAAVPPMPAKPRPRRGLVLVIDDVGYQKRAIKEILTLPGPIAVAVLPDAPWARWAAEQVHARGWPVLLHLPMEPRTEQYRRQMDGYFLRTGMKEGQIAALLGQALEQVPQAIGVNNHMGSMLTEQEAPMRILMRALAARGLFFIDSLTTPRSVAARVADEQGVRWARRDLFFDDRHDARSLAQRWRKALACARKKACIVIAHPYPETIDWFKRKLPALPMPLLPVQATLHDVRVVRR